MHHHVPIQTRCGGFVPAWETQKADEAIKAFILLRQISSVADEIHVQTQKKHPQCICK